jgi:hypothetical protein
MNDPLKIFVATSLETMDLFTQLRPVLEASTKKRSVVLNQSNLNALQHDVVFLYKAALNPLHGSEWKAVADQTQNQIKYMATAVEHQAEALGIKNVSRFIYQINIRVKILKALRLRLGAKYRSETNPLAKKKAKTRNTNV